MRNIFLFIRRYATFLFFLVLQVVSLSFLFRYNKFHEAAFMNVAGNVTGKLDEKFNNIDYYFHLKKTNEDLVRENVYLRSLLRQNYQAPDTLNRMAIDSIIIDSLKKFQRYVYREAKVVGSLTSMQTNYITIHRGSAQGIRKDMGVISPSGIAGRVVNVSENFSTVMSVISRQFRAKAKLKKGGESGTIEWDGVSPLYLSLKDIPKSAKIAIGDTILTSELSSIYPANIMVGTIAGISSEKSSNFYLLRIKPATNFYSIQYVYVIDDLQRDERKKLEEATKLTNE